MTDELDARELGVTIWTITVMSDGAEVYRHCTHFRRLPTACQFVDKAGLFHVCCLPYHAVEE
jgi:hypothetical protein